MSAKDEKKISRRELVRGGVALSLAVIGSSAVLAGCGGKEEANCISPPGLTPEERAKRSQLGYADKSADPARKCVDCAFYTPTEATCGPCTLGLGAVNPEGTCNSFAPRT